MRVIGVDPGSLKSGYGIIEEQRGELHVIDYGVLRTTPKAALPQRLIEIGTRLRTLIDQYTPDELAIEDVFVAKNAKSSLKLGQARGALIFAAGQTGLRIAEYTPLEVKQAVVGYGRAEKAQVQHMVQVLLRLREIPQPDDAADALAIAICHYNSAKMRKQIEKSL